MKSGFNLNVARIRVLRREKGWTQEQLAEIAGVSSRTIQRAESANCAAFETVRAIAAAFEMDFDQLLDSPCCEVPDSESQMIEEPAIPVRRVRMTLQFAAVLAAGLLLGMLVTRHAYFPAGPSPTTRTPNWPEQSRTQPTRPDANQRLAPAGLKTGPARVIEDIRSGRNPEIVGKESGPDRSAQRSAEIFSPADLGSRWAIRPDLLPPSLELPPRSPDLPKAFAVPEVLISSSLPFDLARNGLNTGAVRQAAEHTKDSIGEAFSRIGASMKRVF
jgi:transcriptional regulator with XRE-family HTH domain